MKTKKSTTLISVVIGVAIPCLACVLQWLGWAYIQPFVWFLFYPAVFFSSWLRGMVGGLVATFVSVVLVTFVFIPPQLSFAVQHPQNLISVTMFLVMGALFSLFHQRLQHAQRQASQALESQRSANEQLQRANDRLAREAAIRNNEERLRILVEEASDAVFVHDIEGRIVDVNRHACESLGYSREELLKLTILDVEKDFDLPAARKTWMSVKPEASVTLLGHHRHKNGTTFSVEARINCFEVRGERFFLGLVRDISERLRAEQALNESRERYRKSEARLLLAQEAAKAGSWEWDLRTNENFWSDELWKLYGLEPHSCPPAYATWLSAIHPDDREQAQQSVQNAVLQRAELNVEWRVQLPGNAQRWVLSRGKPVYENGEATRYIGIVLDITERKLMEHQARRWERVFEEAEFGLAYADAFTDQFIAVNSSFARQRGYAREELVGKSLLMLYPPEEIPKMKERLPAINHLGHLVFESVHIRKDGTRFPVLMEVTIIKDSHGNPVSRVAYALDITERKKAEKEIQDLNANLERRVAERTAEWEATNKELESFSYSVSHDLRAPLRGIDGFTQLILSNHGDTLGDSGRGYLNRVISAAERMGHLIDDLLTLSRVTRADLVRELVNITPICERAIDDLRHREPLRQPVVIIAKDLVVNGDRRLLTAMLENLLSNAWKFTSKKSESRIEVGARIEPDGRKVCFIRDNGAGFDMNYANKLFGAFQRLHTMDEFPGTGIGLATVQRIINRHGGRVWAESILEKGATFYFTIPD